MVDNDFTTFLEALDSGCSLNTLDSQTPLVSKVEIWALIGNL